MNEHRCDAKRIGDETGMLAAGPAEGIEHIFGDVVAALHRDGLDRVRHVLDRDPDAALGHLFGRLAVAELPRERLESLAHGVAVERLVVPRSEDAWKKIGDELARHDIRVGDGERAAAPVGEGAGIGSCRIGADAKARAVIMDDRAAAGRDGVDQHHRCAHAHAGDDTLEAPLVDAVIVADIGRGAAHVEADDLGEAGERGRLDRAHDTAGGARQDRVLASEQMGRGQPSRGLHEQEPRRGLVASMARSPSPLWGEGRGEGVCELAFEPLTRRARTRRPLPIGERCRKRPSDTVDVTAKEWREIGIDHGSVAAPDELHERAYFMACRDLREAREPRRLGRGDLMLWVGIGMHEHDGDRSDALGARFPQRGNECAGIERRLDGAVGAHALRHLDHLRIEHRGLLDAAGKDLGPGLIADLERVTKSLAHDQQYGIALALEQRIGGDRRAHFDAVDGTHRQRLPAPHAEQIGDAGNGRVGISLGVVREQLVSEKTAVRGARHDIGERAAAIDEELPLAAHAHPMRVSPAA